MKTETTVDKAEFFQLYEEDSNVKQAAIWEAKDDGCMLFRDETVYLLIVDSTRYFVLLRAPTRIGYCLLAEPNPIGYGDDTRGVQQISVWLDWSVTSSQLLTYRLLTTILQTHDIMFDGKMSKYGVNVWGSFVEMFFSLGFKVGYLKDNRIVNYFSFQEFLRNRRVHWDVEESNLFKIIVRK